MSAALGWGRRGRVASAGVGVGFAVAVALLAACGSAAGPHDGAARTTIRASGVVVGPIGRGAEQVYVLRPRGVVCSIVVFGHGWSDRTPTRYLPWLDHLLRRNNAVIYPRYQLTDDLSQPLARVRDAWRAGIRAGFRRLGRGRVPVVAAGYSFGGGLAYEYAARAASWGVPAPLALQSIFPYAAFLAGPLPLPRATRVLIQVGDRDARVGRRGGERLWRLLSGRPARLQTVRSSDGFVAEHLAPQGTSQAARRAFWGPLDALIAWARAKSPVRPGRLARPPCQPRSLGEALDR
jgi:hypothetical protein